MTDGHIKSVQGFKYYSYSVPKAQAADAPMAQFQSVFLFLDVLLYSYMTPKRGYYLMHPPTGQTSRLQTAKRRNFKGIVALKRRGSKMACFRQVVN